MAEGLFFEGSGSALASFGFWSSARATSSGLAPP